MKPMNLDFTAPGPRPGPISWLLLALGLIALATAGLAWQAADSTAQEARTRLAGRQAAPKPAQSPKSVRNNTDPAAQARQREDSNARRALALPWTRLLTVLQDTRPDDIAFLSLDADGRRGDFQLTADAKSYRAMLDYYRTMQAEPAFKAVSLVRHELREIDGVQGVNFSLRGEWSQP
jgi:hypothetical protein